MDEVNVLSDDDIRKLMMENKPIPSKLRQQLSNIIDSKVNVKLVSSKKRNKRETDQKLDNLYTILKSSNGPVKLRELIDGFGEECFGSTLILRLRKFIAKKTDRKFTLEKTKDGYVLRQVG